MKTEWISVKDRPLYYNNELGWECTEDGNNEFLAAIKEGGSWWIRHCVVEDQIGLMVVGDDGNEPAGYELQDVEYFMIIEPPTE